MSNIDNTFYGTNTDNSTFNPETDKNNLEDRLFFTLLNKNLNYCVKQPVDNSYCKKFYTDADNKINNFIKNEYNNASTYIYSNPMNSVYDPLPLADSVSCVPTMGKNRKKTLKGKYTFPIINSHDPYILNGFPNNINDIKKLKLNQEIFLTNVQTKDIVKFIRLNDTYPEVYSLETNPKCDDQPYRTISDIDKLWSNNGCTNALTDVFTKFNTTPATTYDTLQYTQNSNDITNLFSKFNKQNLYKNQNKNDITTCYKEYVIYDRDDLMTGTNIKSDITIPIMIKPGIAFTNAKRNSTTGERQNVPILKNQYCEVWLTTDGEITLTFNNATGPSYKSGVITNKISTLYMQHDGNLTLNQSNGQYWKSDTSGYTNACFTLNNTIPVILSVKNLDTDKNIKVLYTGPYRSQTDINNMWSNIGCNTKLPDVFTTLNSSYDKLQNTENSNDITTLFSKYNKMNLYKTQIANDIKTCYSNSYVTYDRGDIIGVDNKILPGVVIPTVIKPGIVFNNSRGDVLILQNSLCDVWFTVNGTIALFMKNAEAPIYESSVKKTGGSLLLMQYDGNLTMRDSSGQYWATNTYTYSNAALTLTSIGIIVLLSVKNLDNNKDLDVLYRTENVVRRPSAG